MAFYFEVLVCPHGQTAIALCDEPPEDGSQRITSRDCCGKWRVASLLHMADDAAEGLIKEIGTRLADKSPPLATVLSLLPSERQRDPE